MRKGFFVLLAMLIIGTSFNNSLASIIVPPVTKSSEPDPVKVKTAIAELKNLPAKEKRERIKEARKELKAFNAAKKAHKEPDTNTLLLVIIAILLPPLAVYMHEEEINSKFWISLLLTLIFWLPGVIYALVVILGDQ